MVLLLTTLTVTGRQMAPSTPRVYVLLVLFNDRTLDNPRRPRGCYGRESYARRDSSHSRIIHRNGNGLVGLVRQRRGHRTRDKRLAAT